MLDGIFIGANAKEPILSIKNSLSLLVLYPNKIEILLGSDVINMSKIVLLILLTATCFIVSCKKEKFENEGIYKGGFTSHIDYEVEGKVIETNLNVELRNETDSSIDFEGYELKKNGRRIEGVLPIGSVLWNTKEVSVKLERDIFDTDINGTYTTETYYAGEWRATEGTVLLEHQ